MLQEPSHESAVKIREGRQRASFAHRKLGQGNVVGFYTTQVDSDMDVLREYLKVKDEIYREVWRRQGNEISADFINRVLWPAALHFCCQQSTETTSALTPGHNLPFLPSGSIEPDCRLLLILGREVQLDEGAGRREQDFPIGFHLIAEMVQ
jgi:hypothetical protein